MKAEKKVNFEISAEIIDFETGKILTGQKQTLQNKSEKKACFRTDRRYFCKRTDCACAAECKKLIAIWMR